MVCCSFFLSYCVSHILMTIIKSNQHLYTHKEESFSNKYAVSRHPVLNECTHSSYFSCYNDQGPVRHSIFLLTNVFLSISGPVTLLGSSTLHMYANVQDPHMHAYNIITQTKTIFTFMFSK